MIMARLVKDSELNSEIEYLFRLAEEEIIIISPFIKLHDRIRGILNNRKDDLVNLIIVFGKNPEDKSKSISREDLQFFQEFKDVEIRYNERLHAKFYANERTSVLTSMNLYDFSMNHNIEFGVVTEKKSTLSKMVNFFSDNVSLDDQATLFLLEVVNESKLIFRKTANFKKSLLKKEYTGSSIEVDETQSLFEVRESRVIEKKTAIGYCIRTGIEIPFNPSKPFSPEAYKSWAKYKNPDYPEKYCHRTGKPSNGKTSFNKPFLD